MYQRIALALAAVTAFSATALAAPERERIRGTVTSISADMLTVHTAAGDVPMMISPSTKYVQVKKSSLDAIEQGSYIGTATKSAAGSPLIALEVVVFPPSMKGAGEGHYDWDKLPDTTMGGTKTTESTMTNGTVSMAPTVNSTMTNGTVATSSADGGSKKLMVNYKGGEQSIVVPPTAPIVMLSPGTMSDVEKGSTVFVSAMKDGNKVEANMVAVGKDGAKPPM